MNNEHQNVHLKIIVQKESKNTYNSLLLLVWESFYKDWSIHFIKYILTLSVHRATCSICLFASINSATQICTLPFLYCVDVYVRYCKIFVVVFTHWKGKESYDCNTWGTNHLSNTVYEGSKHCKKQTKKQIKTPPQKNPP